MCNLKQNTLTKSTKRVYEVSIRKYKKFCKKYGFQVFPLNQSCLCINQLAYTCVGSSITMAQGFRNCMQGMHQLHLTMRGVGIKRKHGLEGQQKLCMPISVLTLKQMISYINPSYVNKSDSRMFWAASALVGLLWSFAQFHIHCSNCEVIPS